MRSTTVREVSLAVVAVALAAGLVATGLAWRADRERWRTISARHANNRIMLVEDLTSWRARAELAEQRLAECEGRDER